MALQYEYPFLINVQRDTEEKSHKGKNNQCSSSSGVNNTAIGM